jgi:ankyrin repeat protein
LEVVRVLLDHGADPSIAGEDGLTALGIAEANGHEAVAKLLREKIRPPGASKPAKPASTPAAHVPGASTTPGSFKKKKWWQFWK